MPAKTNPVLGLVIGLIAGYAGLVGGSYAGTRVALTRQVRFDSILRHGLQWLVLLIVIAVVLGLLMAIRPIGAGVMTGTGALMTVSSLAVLLLPIRQAVDVLKLFQLPGTRQPGYLVMDSAVVLFGIVLLLAGIGRWISDAKTARPQVPGQLQDYRGQQQTFPIQPAQQWGGYPGQQQQPPYPGQQQQPYHPGQQPPPGQQQPPG